MYYFPESVTEFCLIEHIFNEHLLYSRLCPGSWCTAGLVYRQGAPVQRMVSVREGWWLPVLTVALFSCEQNPVPVVCGGSVSGCRRHMINTYK